MAAYKDLQLQLAALEQRLSTLSDKEDEFVESVAKEHAAVQVRGEGRGEGSHQRSMKGAVCV